MLAQPGPRWLPVFEEPKPKRLTQLRQPAAAQCMRKVLAAVVMTPMACSIAAAIIPCQLRASAGGDHIKPTSMDETQSEEALCIQLESVVFISNSACQVPLCQVLTVEASLHKPAQLCLQNVFDWKHAVPDC